MQETNLEAFTETSRPMEISQFIETSSPNSATSRERGCTHTSMETLMPNTSSAFKKPLSHHTSMETLEEFPCHQGAFMQTARHDTGDFTANSANPCTINTMIKKEELPACRKGCPTTPIQSSSTSRQVKYCKRRNQLFKKAHELSILCDAEVAAIVFSPSGDMSDFASSSMIHIIKRYQNFQPQMSSNNVLLQDVEKWKRDAIILNNEIKRVEDFQSCVLEKKNTLLSINEFQSVESILEHALNKIRKKKMELFEIETHNIAERGEFVCKENNVLKEKLMEIISTKECASNASSAWNKLYHDQNSVITRLELGLDSLQSTPEENSYSLEN